MASRAAAGDAAAADRIAFSLGAEGEAHPWRFEISLRPATIRTKLKLRLGSESIEGTDVTPAESGLHTFHPEIGYALGATGPDPLFGGEFTTSFSYQYASFDSDGSFGPHAWGAQTITRLETRGSLTQLDLTLQKPFELWERLTLQVGASLENRIFHANFTTDIGSSSLDLNGTTLSPLLGLDFALTPAWSLRAEVEGYKILQVDTDRDRIEDLRRVGVYLRWRGERYGAEIGVCQQEADLVQDKGRIAESFVHSNLTTVFLGFDLRF